MLGKFIIAIIGVTIGYAGIYHYNIIVTMLGIAIALIMSVVLYLDIKEDYIKIYNASHAVSESEDKNG